jgi:hypothetical protein
MSPPNGVLANKNLTTLKYRLTVAPYGSGMAIKYLVHFVCGSVFLVSGLS